MPSQSAVTSTTQLFLDIFDITNDLLIMKDGATSMVLTVSAMNFGLLAEEEQDAIMYAYAGLLNSLNYHIQIVIRSQTKDATKYLNLLKEQEEKASSPMKRRAIEQYRDFVSNLIRERNVLDKKFYVVIPANSLEMGLLPPSTVVPGVKSIDISTVERSVIIEKARTILEPKRDHLIAQFNRIGLFARQLTTQEIIQLFYTSYNPEAAEGQQLTDTANYTTPLISTQGVTAMAPNAQPVSPVPPTTNSPLAAPAPVTPASPAVTPSPAVSSAPELTSAPVAPAITLDSVAAPSAPPAEGPSIPAPAATEPLPSPLATQPTAPPTLNSVPASNPAGNTSPTSPVMTLPTTAPEPTTAQPTMVFTASSTPVTPTPPPLTQPTSPTPAAEAQVPSSLPSMPSPTNVGTITPVSSAGDPNSKPANTSSAPDPAKPATNLGVGTTPPAATSASVETTAPAAPKDDALPPLPEI